VSWGDIIVLAVGFASGGIVGLVGAYVATRSKREG
jgi:hypothetical protein